MNVPPVLYVISFGYRHSDPPVANMVLDVRWLPNPFKIPDYKDLSGRDAAVQEWLFSTDSAHNWLDGVFESFSPLLRAAEEQCSRAVTIAFGCVGGHDRSVAVAERVADVLRNCGMKVMVEHRDIHHRGGR